MRNVRRGPILLLVVVAVVVAVVFQQQDRTTTPSAAASATALDDPGLPSADALSASWFCTEGTSTPDGRADETIIVSSVADREIVATVTVMPGGTAAPASRTLHVDAHREARLRVADVLATAEPGVVVEVTGGPAAVAHEIANTATDDVATEPCSRRAGSDWYFAAGTTVRGSQHYLTLFNPFGDDAVVDVSFVTDAGVQEPDALQALVVPRRSRITRAVHDVVPRQGIVAMHVHARVGRVVAERTMIFDGTAPDDAPARRGISLSLGATSPRRTWDLPFGTNVDGAQSKVGVANFGSRASTVEVAVVLDNDVSLTPQVVSVPSHSVVAVDVATQVPVGSSYTVRAFARDVEGHAPPLVVEMLGWWPDASSSTGVATAVGATRAATRWVIALPGVDGNASVSILNPGGEGLTAEVRSYNRTGGAPSSAPAVAIPASRFASVSLGELGATREQVIVVVADHPVVVGLTVTGVAGAAWMVAVPDFTNGVPA